MIFDDEVVRSMLLIVIPMNCRVFLFFIPCLMACAPMLKTPSERSNVLLAQEEKRDCKKARVVFPAGIYKPEIQSEHGTYYLAPAPMRTEGVLIGGGYRGGLFISNSGIQAAWFGDARDDADERPGTLLGAVGASAPKLWPIKPPLAISKSIHSNISKP